MKSFKEFITESEPNLTGKVLYHGTNTDFDDYDPGMFGKTDPGFIGKGFYLTENRGLANMYAMGAAENHGGEPVVLQFKVYPKKTLILQGTGVNEYNEALSNIGIVPSSNSDKDTKELRKLGYDSIAAYYKGKIKEFVALDAKIVKRVK